MALALPRQSPPRPPEPHTRAAGIAPVPAAHPRTRWRSESGQSLIVVTLGMLLVMAMCALGIDVATWYQKHHQAQVALDAAALAAANCMANAATATPGNTCTSTTDTTDAALVAAQFAADNGVTIPAANVSFDTSNETVTVASSSPAPAYFASIFGIKNAQAYETAAATWNVQSADSGSDDTSTDEQDASTLNSCDSTQAGDGECLFAFGMDQSCPDLGMTLENVGKVNVTGGIWSNSDLETVNADYNSSWGPVWYGNGNLCSWLGASISNGPVFSSGPTAESAFTSWPRDFRSLLACGPSATYTCTGPNGTPSYCTQAAPAFGLNLLGSVTSIPTGALPMIMSPNQVYCAYGTGTKSDPSTWNGVIVMTASNTTTNDSFLGGEVAVTATGSTTLSAALDTSLGHLLVYANDGLLGSPSTAAVAANVATAGSASISGTIFAPNGAITASSVGSGTFKTFLEGYQDVIDAQGSFVGEGPQISMLTQSSSSTTTTTSTTTPGTTTASDALTQ